jgi:lysozyme
MIDIERLKYSLIRHEGMKLKPYTCPAGKLSIGVGRNIEDNGITEEEALFLLEGDIRSTIKECEDEFNRFWYQLNDARKQVLVEMAFNMGLPRVKKFEKFLTAVSKGNFREAASEMMNSLWASQVKKRAVEMAAIMKTGFFAEEQIQD